MDNLKFSKNLIKGKIAELIFEQMFRESGEFTILPFGYEKTLPELAQYEKDIKVKKVTSNIRTAPDYVLLSRKKKEVYLVEVKYQKRRDTKEINEIASKMLKMWNPSWLFIATPEGFFFEPCNMIDTNKGNIGPLYDKWVSKKIQRDYLKLLNKFEV